MALPKVYLLVSQDTRSCASSQERCMAHSVSFAGNITYGRFWPHVSLQLYLADFYQIYIFYVLHVHIKFKRNRLIIVVYKICTPDNYPIFFTFFFLIWTTFFKILSPIKISLPWDWFFSNLVDLKRPIFTWSLRWI